MISLTRQLGNVYADTGQDTLALETFAECIVMMVASNHDPHETADVFSKVGHLYMGQQRYADALVTLKKSLSLREDLANHHPDKSKTLQEIVDLHYKLGLPLQPEGR